MNGPVLLVFAEIVNAEDVFVRDVAGHARFGQKTRLGFGDPAQPASVRIFTATVRPITVSRAR